jgi:hypothetical protein
VIANDIHKGLAAGGKVRNTRSHARYVAVDYFFSRLEDGVKTKVNALVLKSQDLMEDKGLGKARKALQQVGKLHGSGCHP